MSETTLKPGVVTGEGYKALVDAAKTGGFYTVGIGPDERVGHSDVRFNTMKDATLEAVKQHFKDLF